MKIPAKKSALQKSCPDYALDQALGEGGNGVVFSASHSVHGAVAVKFLLNTANKRYARFRDEVNVVTTRLADSPYVIPILEHHLPETGSESNVPWYSMPAAVTLRASLRQASWTERIEALSSLADGLAELHKQQVAHRDIKPENLFMLDDAFRFGDFGLADFPENAGVTSTNEQMGPWAYLAPEMQSNPSLADPFKADVYSLAKTVWAVLTMAKIPFAGQYVPSSPMGLGNFLPESDAQFVFEPLDKLLEVSTSHEPQLRPSATTFARELQAALTIQDNFREANVAQWEAAEREALGEPGLTNAIWRGAETIAAVIRLLSRRHGLNHLFHPNGGGSTVHGAATCEGGEMLSLATSESSYFVVKPVELTLEKFPGRPELNYAVLEVAQVQPLGVGKRFLHSDREWVKRINDFDYAEDDTEADEPQNSHITSYCERYFQAGLFVIAPTGGVFNIVDNYLGSVNEIGRAATRDRFDRFVEHQREQARQKVGMRLVRQVRYLRRAPPVDSEFNLTYLGMAQFEALVRADDRLAAEAKANSSPDGFVHHDFSKLFVVSEAEAHGLGLITGFTPEQKAEFLALVDLGRNSIQPYEFAEHVAWHQRGSHTDQYLVGKLGSGYMRKAAGRFGLTVHVDSNGS